MLCWHGRKAPQSPKSSSSPSQYPPRHRTHNHLNQIQSLILSILHKLKPMEERVMENPGPPWTTARDNAQVGRGKDLHVVYETHIQLGPQGEIGALSGGDNNTDGRTNVEEEPASFLDGDHVSAFVRHQHITFESARLRGLSPAIRLRDSTTARLRSSEAAVTVATPESACSADSDNLTAVTTPSPKSIPAPLSPAPSYLTHLDLADRNSNTEHEEEAEEDEEDDEDEEDEEDGGEAGEAAEDEEVQVEEEAHAQAAEFLPVYRKVDDPPKYATPPASPTAAPSLLPSPPPSPPRKTPMPYIATFYIPTREEVRAVWDEDAESARLQTSARNSTTSAKRTPGFFSIFKHGKNSNRSTLVIPPLRL
ncbi:hypothetical protein CALVIDRAFT_562570 [Calocera viscosa TUFC12733]|uniref:Uncharacterized protein n=1 Tax=Calocera viscosa (strain TUFC12733) TaxID=1330018 RepID=A0A167NXI2_CALVF|nr:hypothetical protein CALVIDRAFT_562570 [Calocera viscosa TUFC12733]